MFFEISHVHHIMKTLKCHIFYISDQPKGFVQSIFAHLYYIRTRMIKKRNGDNI